jgi:hypothetical protein
MLGLFTDHSGIEKNLPAARFGNISMLPDKSAKIEQPNIGEAEAYIVDMHSRSGYSGSPVFVYRTFGADLSFNPDRHFRIRVDERLRDGIELDVDVDTVFEFLGMHYAQFPEDWEIGKRKKTEARRKRLISDDECVTGFSGMTCVIPAWQLAELFEIEELAEMRKAREEDAKEKARGKPVPERAAKESGTSSQDHREDFSRLLRAAVPKKTPSDQT